MIGHLRALISAAEKKIVEIQDQITELKIELEACKQLKPILTRITDNASNGHYSLETAGNSLNSGIKINGVGQGNKILERASKIMELKSNSSVAEANVQARIDEIELLIVELNAEIASLRSQIAGWEAEIQRIEERQRREAELLRKKNKR